MATQKAVPPTHTMVLTRVPADRVDLIEDAVRKHAQSGLARAPPRNPSVTKDKEDPTNLRVVYANFKGAESAREAVAALQRWLGERTWPGAQYIQVYVKADGSRRATSTITCPPCPQPRQNWTNAHPTQTVMLTKVPVEKERVIMDAVRHDTADLSGPPHRNPSCVDDKWDEKLRVVYANFQSPRSAQDAKVTLQRWLDQQKWPGAEHIQVFVKADGPSSVQETTQPDGAGARALADGEAAVAARAVANYEASSALVPSTTTVDNEWAAVGRDGGTTASSPSAASPYTEAPVPSTGLRGAWNRTVHGTGIAEVADCGAAWSGNSDSEPGWFIPNRSADGEPDGAGALAAYFEDAGGVAITDGFFMTGSEEQHHEEIEAFLRDDWCKQQEEEEEEEEEPDELELTAEIAECGEEFWGEDEEDTPAALKRKHVLETLILTVGQDVLQLAVRKCLARALGSADPIRFEDLHFQVDGKVFTKRDAPEFDCKIDIPASIRVPKDALETALGEDAWSQLREGDMLRVWALHNRYAVNAGHNAKLTAVRASRLDSSVSSQPQIRLGGLGRDGPGELCLSLDSLDPSVARSLVKNAHKQEKWDISLLCPILTRINEMKRVLQPKHLQRENSTASQTRQREDFLELLYQNTLYTADERDRRLQQCHDALDCSAIVAVDVLRHLRNLLHHDHDKVTTGLVTAAFDDLWTLAAKAILRLASIEDDQKGSRKRYESKIMELKSDMDREISRELSSTGDLGVRFQALLDRMQDLQQCQIECLAWGARTPGDGDEDGSIGAWEGGGDESEENEAAPGGNKRERRRDEIDLLRSDIQGKWQEFQDSVERMLQNLHVDVLESGGGGVIGVVGAS